MTFSCHYAISLKYLYVMQTSQNILPAKSTQLKKQPKIYLLKKAKKSE